MKNVENQNRNYQILNNMIEINDNDIIKDIKLILDEKIMKNKINLILDIIDKNEIFNNDEITLIYKKDNNENKIKIFDSVFVQNNKDICKIIYDNKEIELKKEKIEIKLKGFKNIINANKMFFNCKALISIPDINKWDLSNVTDKNEMFKGCNQSLIFP